MWDVQDLARYAAMLAGPHTIRPSIVSTLDGDQLAELAPETWQITKTLRGSQTESRLELVIADPDGTLLTDKPDAALQTYGQQVALTVTVESSGWEETMPMGRWLCRESVPAGSRWRLYPNGQWARGGQRVTTSCEDLLATLADFDFLGRSAPPTGATTTSELPRLVEGALPVDVDAVPAQPVAKTPWEGTRLDAVVAVIGDASGVADVDRSGALTAIPAAGTGAVHVIRPADTTGYVEGVATGLIDWSPRASRDGIYNALALTGQRADGATLYAAAYETSGPTRWDGPHGRCVLREHNPQLTTQAAVDRASVRRLAELKAARSQILEVQIMPNPAIDLLDTARIELPAAARAIDGLIVGYTIGSHGPMHLQVSVPHGALIYG